MLEFRACKLYLSYIKFVNIKFVNYINRACKMYYLWKHFFIALAAYWSPFVTNMFKRFKNLFFVVVVVIVYRIYLSLSHDCIISVMFTTLKTCYND